jgi:Ca2+-binding RTX toxin-like protein
MGTKNLNQDTNTTWTIDTSNDQYTLAKSAKITTVGESAIEVLANANNNSILLNGDIEATDTLAAVRILGNGTSLEIAETSRVDGDGANYGILNTGANFSMVNDGVVFGDSYAASVGDFAEIRSTGEFSGSQVAIGAGEGLNLRNTGEIAADTYGILADAAGTVIRNGEGGSIVAGIGIGLTNEGTSVIKNSGMIMAVTAINDGAGETTVINKGLIAGNVFLGAGDDVFNTRKGEFKSIVNGGDGDDLYVIGKSNTQIVEQPGFGYDEVRSTASFTLGENLDDLTLIGGKNATASGNEGNNVLTGNRGNNILNGLGGDDYLIGGKGDDTMFGGAGQDMFDFKKGTGNDIASDFTDGEDLVFCLFANSGPEIADLIANHAVEKNGGVMITYGEDSLFLNGMTLNKLDESDFFTGL